MSTVVTTVKIDPELKKDAKVLFDSLGISLNSAITVFLLQAVREQAIPFRIGVPAGLYSGRFVDDI